MEVCRRYRKGEAGLAWRVERRGGDLEEKYGGGWEAGGVSVSWSGRWLPGGRLLDIQ